MRYMLYVLGILTALQIVLAQSLWKIGLEKLDFQPQLSFILSTQIFKVLLSTYIIAGVLLYVSATLSFFVLLSRYEYSNAQTIVVTSSLMITFTSAILLFNEKFSVVNGLGILLVLCGVVLITKF